MLNQHCALTKLRAELEGKKERKCQSYKRFRHLAYNCRNKCEEDKRKAFPQNKFEVLANKVMRCKVREKVKVKRQEIVKVKYFKC